MKEDLAQEMVARYHGEDLAKAERQKFNAVHVDGGFPADAPSLTVKQGPDAAPVAFLTESGLAESRGDAKRQISAGALAINGEKCADPTTPLAVGQYQIRLGKKKFLILGVE